MARAHGTRSRYVADRCRCEPCTAANRDYHRSNERRRAHAAANPARQYLVDAEPVRAHVRSLQDGGMGWRTIAARAGVNGSVVKKLLWGHAARGQSPAKRVRPETAQRLLAVRLELANHAKVPSIGTQRRLQALVALGWSQSKLAAELGLTPANFGTTIHHSGQVYESTARAVRELYERLWHTPPPEESHRDKISASRARSTAAGNGWAVPMAWDDDTIDDPHAQPVTGDAKDDEVDPVAVERACAGERPTKLRPVDRAAAIRRMANDGVAPTTIARRLRIALRNVKPHLEEPAPQAQEVVA